MSSMAKKQKDLSNSPVGFFDRETLTFVQCDPAVRATNTIDWVWEGSGLKNATEQAIARALEHVAAGEER